MGATPTPGATLAAEDTATGRDADVGPQAVVVVSVGAEHTCAIRGSGWVICWGLNGYGQNEVPPGFYRSVSAGETHTCVVHRSGELEC